MHCPSLNNLVFYLLLIVFLLNFVILEVRDQLKIQADIRKQKNKKTDEKNIDISNIVDFNELLNNKPNPANNFV
jgi:hypothetical protein